MVNDNSMMINKNTIKTPKIHQIVTPKMLKPLPNLPLASMWTPLPTIRLFTLVLVFPLFPFCQWVHSDVDWECPLKSISIGPCCLGHPNHWWYAL